MTRKDLTIFARNNAVEKVIAGYGCFTNLPANEKEKFVFVGRNTGVYGWNWSAYYNPQTQELRIDNYRNVPRSVGGVVVEFY